MTIIQNDRYPKNDNTEVTVHAGDIRTLVEMARALRVSEAHIQPVVRAQSATLASAAGSISNPVCARYTNTVVQSIPDTTDTIINYGTADYDTHSRVTVGAGWVFTAAVAGKYHVDAAAHFAASTAWAIGERAVLSIAKNGTIVSNLDRTDNHTTTLHQVWVGGSDDVNLAAGDTISIIINQNSGGALNLSTSALNNHVAIHKIG